MIRTLIVLVGVQHFFIMVMEMFLWEKRGPMIFKSFDKELFAKTTAMAKNMGLYNGFIGAGLIGSLFLPDPMIAKYVAIYFLFCVVIAGLYASLTAEKSIFLKQSTLAVVALVLMIFM